MSEARQHFSCFAIFLASIGCVVQITAAADDAQNTALNLQTRLETGAAFYEVQLGAISESLIGPTADTTSIVSTTKQKFGNTLPTVSGGITFVLDRFYVDLSTLRTVDSRGDDDTSTIDILSPALATRTDLRLESELNRQEYAIAVGYGLSENVSVFAGYKWVKNDYDDIMGSGPTTLRFADGTTRSGQFNSRAKFEFDHDGPFIGATVAWNIGQGSLAGTLGTTVAMGFFEGDLDVSGDAAFIAVDGQELPVLPSAEDIFETGGDTLGISLGVTWQGLTPVNGLSYSVGVNGYSYNFEADERGRADIDETILNFRLGLSYQF